MLPPTYSASDGDPTIFYATTAGILSGSVAGNHVSPISDTTVLSSLACNCYLLAHLRTQAPYVLVISVVSILFGTIPIGYNAWHNGVGIVLGALSTIAFVYGLCAPVISKSGRFDPLSELIFHYTAYRDEESDKLQIKNDTIKVFNGESLTNPYLETNSLDDEEGGEMSVDSEGGQLDIMESVEKGVQEDCGKGVHDGVEESTSEEDYTCSDVATSSVSCVLEYRNHNAFK